jgi:hypothetical protein
MPTVSLFDKPRTWGFCVALLISAGLFAGVVLGG